MNIGIIASGGDGAGMNNCLYELVNGLSGHKITLFEYGYQGIIDNKVVKIPLSKLKLSKNDGGVIIKSSRSKEFMTEIGFKKALLTLKNEKIDLLIIMGGNGSLNGARELIKNNVKVIFIPTTIDNDILLTDYCIGFDSAVSQAINFIKAVDVSMQSFDRICIYEVMGRHCPDLAYSVGRLCQAGYVYTSIGSKEKMLKGVKDQIERGNFSPIVVLQENVINIELLKKYLQKNLKDRDIKTSIIGYYQRGGKASKIEMKYSSDFAKKCIECVENKKYNVIIIKKGEQTDISKIDI